MSKKTSLKVFVSYGHADSKHLTRLQTHLKPLVRDENIDLWDDTRLKAGVKWREEIKAAIESCDVAVLLVSADFLASDFIAKNELPPLLKKAASGGTLILSVVISSCLFAYTKKLSAIQTVNDPAKPLISLTKNEREKIWTDLAKRLESHRGSKKKASAKKPRKKKTGASKVELAAIATILKAPKPSYSILSTLQPTMQVRLEQAGGHTVPIRYNGTSFTVGAACPGNPEEYLYNIDTNSWKKL